jgi:putative endonuclease
MLRLDQPAQPGARRPPRSIFRDNHGQAAAMSPRRSYYVYILSSRSGVLYIGVTNHLERRILEHKQKRGSSFTKRYNVTRLAYFEETDDIHAAIAREKEIKGWLRSKKIALIKSMNPKWEDLSEGWYDEELLTLETRS